MKSIKLLALMLLLGLTVKESRSQCIIDNGNTTDGFSPASLPCIQPGVYYEQTMQLHIPATTTYLGSSATVDSLYLLSITGLPAGINYSSNPSGVVVPGGNNACILFYGTSNAAPGNYELTFHVRGWTHIFGTAFGPIDSTTNAAGWTYSLDVCSQGQCDSLSNIYTNDSYITYYADFDYPIDTGYLSGTNIFGDKAKAERFTNPHPGYKITEASLFFGAAATSNPSRVITVNIYSNNGLGTGGSPGTVIASQTTTLGTIVNNRNSLVPTIITFASQPVINDTAFYVGVVLPTQLGDTLAFLTNDGSTGNGRGWEQYSNNTWHTYLARWGYTLANAVFPVLCPSITGPSPVADFTITPAAGCRNVPFQLTDNSTNSPTSWSWTMSGGSPSTSSQPNPAVTYSSPGTYTITLTATNANGSNSISKTVVVSPPPSITLTKTDATCTQGGTITSNITGGSGFTYMWSNSLTSANLNNLAVGTYFLTVTNSGGCTASSSATIVAAGGISVSLSKTDPTCSQSNGSIIATPSGGSGYTFSWSNGGSSGTNNNLGAGPYTVTVTASNGCSATSSITLTSAGGISVSLSKTDPTCSQSNGSITATPSGGSGYTFSWSIGGSSGTNNNLGAGPYTVTVTASNGCSATSSITLTATGGITVSLSKTNATCNQSNGSITSNVSGGSGYTYSWSNGSTLANLTNLSAGNYSVTVNATGGCSATASATITSSGSSPSATTSVTVVPNCGQSNGSVMVTASGGTPGYTYHWSTGSNSTTITNITAGSYSVTVTDVAGCSASAVSNVGNVGGPTVIVQSQTNVSCNGGGNGAVTVVASSGTAPYNYSSNGTNFQSSASFSGLAAGSYTFYARDANQCISTTGATVTQPNPITISITKTDVNCFGNNTGTATANVSGGTPQYTYVWSNSQSGLLAVNLTAGPYTLVVTDNNNCTASSPITITQPAAALSAPVSISNEVSCFGGNNGIAAVNASGGTTPYNYQWSNGQNVNSISNLSAASYRITVTDSKSCTATGSGTVSQPTAALNVSTSSVVASTASAHDGSATANVSGGTTPYNYLWSNGSVTASTGNTLASGNYTVTVTDANSCSVTQSIAVAFSTGISTLGLDGNCIIYPNPTSGDLFIAVELKQPQDIRMEVLNNVGATIISRNYSGADKVSARFDLSGFAGGIYIVHIVSDNKTMTKKISFMTN